MSNYLIRVDKPNYEKNIVDSSLGVKHNDKEFIVDCPLSTNQLPEFDSIEDRFIHLLYKSFNYTSKYINVDELTGENYNDNELYMKYLRGRDAMNTHMCAGCIMFHEKNEHMFLWLEILFWDINNIIPAEFHNLKNIDINIERSNGDIEIGKINDSSFRVSKSTNEYVIHVQVLDENGLYDKYKHVTLSKINQLNPDLSFIISLPKIETSELPDWVLSHYTNWKQNLYKNINWDLNKLALK